MTPHPAASLWRLSIAGRVVGYVQARTLRLAVAKARRLPEIGRRPRREFSVERRQALKVMGGMLE